MPRHSTAPSPEEDEQLLPAVDIPGNCETATSPQSPRLRTRKRRRKPKLELGSGIHILIRATIIILIAFAFLIVWQQTAHSQVITTSADAKSQASELFRKAQTKSKKKAPKATSQPASTSQPKTPKKSSTKNPVDENNPIVPPQSSLPIDPLKVKAVAKSMGDPVQAKSAEPPAPSFATQAQALSKIADNELKWTETRELMLALELEFSAHAPIGKIEIIKNAMTAHLIRLSARSTATDVARDNMRSLLGYLKEVLHLEATERPEAQLSRLLPRHVLANKRGSPLGVGVILLTLADDLNDYLVLEPILADDLLGFRYRSGSHRYTIVPTRLDQLYTDEEFARLSYGHQHAQAPDLKILTRQEFWALVIGEAGSALAGDGESARAMLMIQRALGLYREQSLPRISLAKLLMARRDFKTAREELDLALRLEPNRISARLARVELLEKLGDTDAVEADLRWLFHSAKPNIDSGIRLVYHYLARNLIRAAKQEFKRLQNRSLSPSQLAKVKTLGLEVGAAPWIQRLSSSNIRDRFEALDQLASYPIPRVEDAIVELVEASNFRLANYAHFKLLQITKVDQSGTKRSVQSWRDLLKRRRAPIKP